MDTEVLYLTSYENLYLMLIVNYILNFSLFNNNILTIWKLYTMYFNNIHQHPQFLLDSPYLPLTPYPSNFFVCGYLWINLIGVVLKLQIYGIVMFLNMFYVYILLDEHKHLVLVLIQNIYKCQAQFTTCILNAMIYLWLELFIII